MLRTFRVNDVCKFHNAELYEQAIEYARSKGVPVFSESKKSSFREFPNIFFKYIGCLVGCANGEGYNEITIWEFFQFCDNWKECGSKPSEGEYIRHGAKVKVRDDESDDWKTGWRYVGKVYEDPYHYHVFNDNQKHYDDYRFCELDETPEQSEMQKQIAELETKMEEMKATIQKLKDADAN